MNRIFIKCKKELVIDQPTSKQKHIRIENLHQMPHICLKSPELYYFPLTKADYSNGTDQSRSGN